MHFILSAWLFLFYILRCLLAFTKILYKFLHRLHLTNDFEDDFNFGYFRILIWILELLCLQRSQILQMVFYLLVYRQLLAVFDF